MSRPTDPSPPEHDAHDRRPEPATAMLRHLLAALAYRTRKALRDAPPDFGTFDGGHGLRTPHQIVRHMNGLIGRTHARLTDTAFVDPDDDWDASVARFPELLERLDDVLAAEPLRPETLEQLQQGPIADALTHAGQLAMLRRMAGAPIAGENFMVADIRTGSFDDR